MQFHHISYAQSVSFGAGEATGNLLREVERLNSKRPLLIHAPETAELAENVIGSLQLVARISEAPQHVPVAAAKAARMTARTSEADLLISVGGGSATGLAKAVALELGLPIIAVPTTYAGSEATWMWGMTENGEKKTGSDSVVLPSAVVYDSDLLKGLPTSMAAASALNAVAHCVDSFWAPKANPITSAEAASGLDALARGIELLSAAPDSVEGRDACLFGTYLSARAFAASGSGLHHKICHVLGGAYNMPHAQTHATVLPYVVAQTVPHAPEARRLLARALGTTEEGVVEAVSELRVTAGAKYTLEELGLPAEGIGVIAKKVASAVPAGHPGPKDEEHLRALIEAAWSGASPLDLIADSAAV